jgi:hypothetical protein
MSETVAIILSFRPDARNQFEQLFSEEVYPLWKEYQAQGKILAASLTPALDSPEKSDLVQEYILLVEVPSRAEHDQFDTDRRFLSFLDKVKPSQPVEPKVWLGNTLFKVG